MCVDAGARCGFAFGHQSANNRGLCGCIRVPAALWRIVWDDTEDEEDMEEQEVTSPSLAVLSLYGKSGTEMQDAM